MFKWLFILFGVVVFIGVAIFSYIAFTVWNFERGYPKSVLAKELKGTCVISKKTFALVKVGRGYIGEKVFDFLPKPEGRDYFYSSYLPGTITTQDGSDVHDLTEAVVLPEGTKFILKDGFQNRNMNGSDYYFWLEPEGVEIDSHFFFTPLGLSIEKPEGGGVEFYSDEEMTRFPESLLFKKACD